MLRMVFLLKIYKKLLRDDDAIIRRQAIHFITEQPVSFSKQFTDEFLDLAKNDKAADVKLMIASLTQNRLDKTLSEKIISTMVSDPNNVSDRFVSKMLWYGYAQFIDQKDVNDIRKLLEVAKSPIFKSSAVFTLLKKSPQTLIEMAAQSNNGSLKSLIISQLWKRFGEGEDKQYFKSEAWEKLKLTDVSSLDEYAQNNLQDLIILSENKKLSSVEEIHELRIKKGKQAFVMCATCHQPNKSGAGPSLKEISRIYSHPDPKNKRNISLKNDLIKWIKKPGKKRDNYPYMPAFASLDKEVYEQLVAYIQDCGQKTLKEEK